MGKNFFEISKYYANLIDYARCLLGVISSVLIQHWPEQTWLIASGIMLNTLLDWVDGPVARMYGQSTVMGCGWDWLADIFAQYNITVWCM